MDVVVGARSGPGRGAGRALAGQPPTGDDDALAAVAKLRRRGDAGGSGEEANPWKRRAVELEARVARQAALLELRTAENAQLEAKNAVLEQRVEELTALCGATPVDECEKLRRRVGQLERQVRDLQAQLAAARREARRQAAPFARRNGKKHRRKPGRKKGHPGARRAVPDHVDETRSTTLEACPDCHYDGLRGIKDHVNYALELPPIAPRVICYQWQSGYCPCCRGRKRSRHPEQPSWAQGAALVALGPRALAIAATLKIRHAVAFRRVAELFVVVFGMQFTAGALALALQRLGRRLDETYGALIAALQVSEAVFVDETGWRVLRVLTWLWVFTSKDVTVYVIDPRKGHEVPLGFLGASYAGVIHHDGARSYDSLPYRHQTCLEHILRDLDELVEAKTRGAVRWPRAVAELLRDAVVLRKRKGVQPSGAEATPTDRAGQVEQRLDRLLVADLTDPDNQRMQRRLERNRDQLFTFLYLDEAEATTARAEQQIRPMVANRKNGACNRTWAGARATQILGSIVATARQQGHNPYEVLMEAASRPKGHVIERLIPPRPGDATPKRSPRAPDEHPP